MKTAILLTVASLAAVLGASPKPADEVKTDAAAGRYNRRGGYDRPSYGGYGYQQPIGYWQPLVQDRFVCDLDASVLLVVDSNRHHHHHNRHSSSSSAYYGNPSVPANRAVRVKCSEVANHDVDSCNLCCQQTARRDTSLANDALFGFLAITKTDDDETFKRSKRGADEDEDEDDDDESPEDRGRRGKYHRVDSTYVSEADWSPPKYHTNVKCVCCAPRNNPAAQNPSTGYSNTAQSPPAASNPSYNSNTFTAVPAPVNTAAVQPLVDSWQTDSGNQGSWNSGATNTAAVTGNQGSWNSAASAPASVGNQGSWNSGANTANTAAAASGANWNSGAATSSDSSAWGAASDAAAPPAPPPAAAAVSSAPGNKY